MEEKDRRYIPKTNSDPIIVAKMVFMYAMNSRLGRW